MGAQATGDDDDVEALEHRMAQLDAQQSYLEAAEVAVEVARRVWDADGPQPSVERYERALQRLEALDGDDAVELRVMAGSDLAAALQAAGRRDDAAQAAHRIVQRHLDDAPRRVADEMADAVLIVAQAWRGTGRRDAAVELLHRARRGFADDQEGTEYGLVLLDAEIVSALLETDPHRALAQATDLAQRLDAPAADHQGHLRATALSLRAEALLRLGRHDDARAVLEVLERCVDADYAQWARETIGYSLYERGHDLVLRFGRAAEAELLLRQAIAQGIFGAWLDLAEALALTSRSLDEQEHALRQAVTYSDDADRQGYAALRLGQVLAHCRGDIDAARTVLAHAADTPSAFAGQAAAQVDRLERPGRRLRAWRWRIRRRRRALVRASAPARWLARPRR